MNFFNKLKSYTQIRSAELLTVIVISLLYFLSANNALFGQYADDFKYVLFGENLSRFDFSSPWSAHALFETSINWGTSIFLAPVLKFLGRNILILKLYFTSLLLAGTFLFYFSTKRFIVNYLHIPYLVFLFGNGLYLSNSGLILSEIPFIFMMGVFSWIILKPVSFKRSLALGLVTGFLILIRPFGLLVPLICVGTVFQGQKVKFSLVYIAATCFIFSPAIITSILNSGDISFYSKYWGLLGKVNFGDFIAGILNKVFFYLKGMSGLTFFYAPGLLPNWLAIKIIIIGLVWITFGAGLIINGSHSGWKFFKFYFVIYMGVITFWPYYDVRYVRTIYPFFILIFMSGLGQFSFFKNRNWAVPSFVILCLLSNSPEIKRTLLASFQQPLIIPHRTYDWINENVSSEAEIISPNIAAVTYFCGNKGFPSLHFEKPAELVDKMKDKNLHFIVIQDSSLVTISKGVSDPIYAQAQHLKSSLSDTSLFKLIYNNTAEGVGVYKIM